MKHRANINSKKEQGFTLIELIVVIVILGILAVTAAPKFISITSDAKAAQRKGVVGSVQSALSLGYAKAAITGGTALSGADIEVSVNSELVNFVYGYPSVIADATPDGTAGKAYNLERLITLDGVDSVAVSGSVMTITLDSDCTVTVTNATGAGAEPAIGGSTTCA
jgi:MSHA pilin protein MshA